MTTINSNINSVGINQQKIKSKNNTDENNKDFNLELEKAKNEHEVSPMVSGGGGDKPSRPGGGG